MMKQLKFLETKRTPRYSLRKFSVGMVSVLLGVTIFGINFTNHSVKAATTNGNLQQTSAVVLTTAERTNTQKATGATGEVQQSSAATANNSTEAATTLQSAPKTQGSADTDIRSLTAISAAKLATMNLLRMNLMQTTGTTGTTGTNTSAAGTVDKNHANTQSAKENQELANKTNLTSSDNYSSNIYEGTDGKYYKIITIYGNDYVYHAADIQANGTATWQKATTAEDTKNNIHISKEDLGNGKTRWTVVFFPNKGLQNVGSKVSGLVSAKFGIALTNDYQIVGNVDMDVINDPNQTYTYYKFEDGSNSPTDITVQNPPAEVKFSFNPNTDVDPNTGLINSKNMPAYNNKYLQGSYYFTTATNVGAKNLWQTYFFNKGNEVYDNNAYDGKTPYLGGDHDFHLNNFIIKNETGVDGAGFKDPIIYDGLGNKLNPENGVVNSNGVFNSVNFNQAMEFKSHGYASKKIKTDLSQHSSYVISFTTKHTDSHEVDLATNPKKKQQFSGISANIYSYQNGYYNMFSRLYGEQRALNAAGVSFRTIPLGGTIKVDKDAQLTSTDAQSAITNTRKLPTGTTYSWDVKKLPDTSKPGDWSAVVVVKYPDNSTDNVNVTVHVNGDSDKITPKVPSTKEPVADTSNLTKDEQAKVQKNVEDANKGNFPAGTTVKVGADGKATVTYPDTTTDTIEGSKLVRPTEDKDNYDPHGPKNPDDRVPVKDPDHLTDGEKNDVKDEIGKENPDLPKGTEVDVDDKGNATIKYPDGSKDTIPGSDLVRPTEDKDNYDPHGPKNPDDRVPVKDPDHLTDGEKNDVKDEIGKENPDLPKGTEVDVDDKGNATIKYPDGSQDTIPGDQLVQGQKGDTTDAGNITPTIPGGKVTVKDPSHLTETEKGEVKNNVDNANKDKFPAGTEITVGKDGTATITYPDKSTDTIPGDKLVKGEDSGSTSGQTDAGNITPTIPGDKVTVKDPSHLTDDEKNQVKDNVDNANKGNFPAGTNITVGDDGTTTVTYPDGSKDTIPGRDLIIGVKAVNNQVVDANGNVLVGWKVVNGQPVKSSDQPVMTREAHKAQQAKTLPQTGEKDNKLGILGLLSVSLASLFGLGEKKKKED